MFVHQITGLNGSATEDCGGQSCVIVYGRVRIVAQSPRDPAIDPSQHLSELVVTRCDGDQVVKGVPTRLICLGMRSGSSPVDDLLQINCHRSALVSCSKLSSENFQSVSDFEQLAIILPQRGRYRRTSVTNGGDEALRFELRESLAYGYP